MLTIRPRLLQILLFAFGHFFNGIRHFDLPEVPDSVLDGIDRNVPVGQLGGHSGVSALGHRLDRLVSNLLDAVDAGSGFGDFFYVDFRVLEFYSRWFE